MSQMQSVHSALQFRVYVKVAYINVIMKLTLSIL